MTGTTNTELPLFLGCPVWACGHWGGEVYPVRTPRKDWLHWYSRTFNTVEGNSTFYALPGPDAIQRWVEQTPDHFRFALKFPRTISHELELEHSQTATREFLQRIEPLREALRLGPTFCSWGRDLVRIDCRCSPVFLTICRGTLPGRWNSDTTTGLIRERTKNE